MAKNSNYKNDPRAKEREAAEKAEAAAKEKRKNIIICTTTVISALILSVGIIIGALVGYLSNKTVVEMEFEGYGKIYLAIDNDAAPKTAENFIDLVNRGFYDGLKVNRAQQGFVIQGGENETANLTPIKGEFASNGFNNKISHKRGVISMARTTDPNSATSQFFITLDDSAKEPLDGNYAGFGYVIFGMGTVDKIASALRPYALNEMGFVSDSNAIKIAYAKVVKK